MKENLRFINCHYYLLSNISRKHFYKGNYIFTASNEVLQISEINYEDKTFTSTTGLILPLEGHRIVGSTADLECITKLDWTTCHILYHYEIFTEVNCMTCGNLFLGPEPQTCCSGRDCGCMGQPIEPIVCSEECYNNLLNKHK